MKGTYRVEIHLDGSTSMTVYKIYGCNPYQERKQDWESQKKRPHGVSSRAYAREEGKSNAYQERSDFSVNDHV